VPGATFGGSCSSLTSPHSGTLARRAYRWQVTNIDVQTLLGLYKAARSKDGRNLFLGSSGTGAPYDEDRK
jgi:hypothetical protein